MNAMRWRQLWAVFRLEVGKSFLSRRGLWIYALALLPVLLFGGHALLSQRQHRERIAKATPGATREMFRSIHTGMPREEVLRLLPKPNRQFSFRRRGEDREFLSYSDGATEWNISLRAGKVSAVNTRSDCDLAEDTMIFAGVFQFFYLRLAVFFGCVFVFINLFRGEILDKSLHYYFLAPVRREIVVIGKYLAGLVATIVIFVGSVALQLALLYAHLDSAAIEAYLANGNGWQHAASYLGVTALACVGYGSVFLAAGVLVRNPLVPAALILLWESINGVLPAALRQVSVIYYLKSLCPVEVPIGRDVPPPLALLALNVDPAPAWIAIPGLFAVTALLVWVAARRARRMEISYAAD